jgi:Dolichyl-phosphate-mannose-protein mannosyltransferase
MAPRRCLPSCTLVSFVVENLYSVQGNAREPASAKLRFYLENSFKTDSPLARSILLLAFLLRLWKASGTFLNLDEAMHFLAANKYSLAEAYRASLGLAHPPLLILLLNIWRRLGSSELFLRLPLVVAGTIVCWIFFKWLTRILGPAVGWCGFVLVGFLPPFVELSAEVRQYPLLLCFMMAASYILDLALTQSSAGKMAAFFAFLYLAMLTHFSAILFAAAAGAYSLWRLIITRQRRHLVMAWLAGQAAALWLFIFLYRTQISRLKGSIAAQHMQVLLSNSYFHRGHDHLIWFLIARTFGVFQYTFGQLVVGDIAGVLFLVGIVLLVRGKQGQEQPGPSPRQFGFFLVLPFLINWAAATMNLYPYGGTRHSAFLMPFAVAGVSPAVAKLAREKFALTSGGAILIVAICQLLGVPHRPYMLREDQHRVNMTQAINAIRQRVSAEDTIFVDFQTSFLLRFYLCPDAIPLGLPDAPLRTYPCDGYRVVSTDSDTTILTADTFLRPWNDLKRTGNLKPGQTVWIFQAGWDIALARQLRERFPEFHDLKSDSFGRNISLFKLTI